MPVNSGISPARALAYRPLRSRRSHSSRGVATWTRKNAPPAASTMSWTCSRVSANGAIGEQTATPPWRAISAATQPMRRVFVSPAALLKQEVHQRAGEGRLAAPGQAGEEEHEALLLGRRLVGVHDRCDGGGVA